MSRVALKIWVRPTAVYRYTLARVACRVTSDFFGALVWVTCRVCLRGWVACCLFLFLVFEVCFVFYDYPWYVQPAGTPTAVFQSPAFRLVTPSRVLSFQLTTSRRRKSCEKKIKSAVGTPIKKHPSQEHSAVSGERPTRHVPPH